MLYVDPSGEQIAVGDYPPFITFPKGELMQVPPTAIFFNEYSAGYFSERILGGGAGSGDRYRPLHWEPGALDILYSQRQMEETNITMIIILLGTGLGFATGSVAASTSAITTGAQAVISGAASAASATAAYNSQYLSAFDPNGTLHAIEVLEFMKRAINGILRETKDYREKYEDEHNGCEPPSLPVEPWIAFWFSDPPKGDWMYRLHTYYMFPSHNHANGYDTHTDDIPVAPFLYELLKVQDNGIGIGTDEDYFLTVPIDQHEHPERFK